MSSIELNGSISTELATLLGGLREEFDQLRQMVSNLASGLDYVAEKDGEDSVCTPSRLFAHVAMEQVNRCTVIESQLNLVCGQIKKAGLA